jgi:uncharacterized membrane protein YkvA (DUF1232 family)
MLEKWKKRAKSLKLEITAIYLAYKHPKTPWHVRLFLICLLAMALSPLDLIPDFLPVLGYLDDLLLIPIGIALAIRMIPPKIMEECRNKARSDANGKAVTGRIGTVVIILIWLSGLAISGWVAWRFYME